MGQSLDSPPNIIKILRNDLNRVPLGRAPLRHAPWCQSWCLPFRLRFLMLSSAQSTEGAQRNEVSSYFGWSTRCV